jgi:hypothetical protein
MTRGWRDFARWIAFAICSLDLNSITFDAPDFDLWLIAESKNSITQLRKQGKRNLYTIA